MRRGMNRTGEVGVPPQVLPRPPIRLGRTFAWLAFLGGTGAVLWLLGQGPLRGPAILHPQGWVEWAKVHGAVLVAFVILRVLGLAGAAYVIGITVLGLVARASRRRLPRRLVTAITVPGLRRFLDASLSLGLTAAVIAGPITSSAWASPRRVPVATSAPTPLRVHHSQESGTTGPSAPVLRLIGPRDPTGQATKPPRRNPDPSPTPELRLLDPARPDADPARPAGKIRPPAASSGSGAYNPPQRPLPATGTPAGGPAPPIAPRPAAPRAAAGAVGVGPGRAGPAAAGTVGVGPGGARPAAAGAVGVGPGEARPGGARPARATWVLRPGDSLWQVAEATLTKAWGRTPPEEVVAHYWWAVVTINRPHLPDPANPDLVFPGEVITLPPPPET